MKIPKHIGFIMDGNRRFSRRLMKEPWKGHEYGADKVEKLLGWLGDLGIKETTLYAFSSENTKRPKKEFDFLMNIFEKEFTRLKDDKRLEENGIRINIVGNTSIFPEKIQKKLKEIQEKTKNNNNYIVNFAMGYNGRDEIVEAVKKTAEDVMEGKLDKEEIDRETISERLYLNSDPDIIVRTSGEKRLSGFLMWQSCYSELMFIDKYWPEIEKEDIEKVIEEYSRRKRRFGK
ncbi:MAG: polyprenyl diphosphate synthase [Nanobdellota archaeon]